MFPLLPLATSKQRSQHQELDYRQRRHISDNVKHGTVAV